MKLSLTIGLSLILSCTILDVVGAYGYNRLGQPEENLIREPGRVDYDLETGNDEPWWKNDEEYLSADEMIGKLPDAMEEDPRSRTERVDDNIETPKQWYDINGDDQELIPYQDTADNLDWNDQSNDNDNREDDNLIVDDDEKETQFDIDAVNEENEIDNEDLTNLDEDLTNLDEDEIDESGGDYANLGGDDEHINFDDDGNWDDQEKDQFEDNENPNFDEDGDWDENDDEQEDQLTGKRYKRQVDSISDSRNEDFNFEEELPSSEGFEYSYIQ